MPPSQQNDQPLLDRLNALKPTSITLDRPENTVTLPASEGQAVSREDALAARLRSLRSQASSGSGSEGISLTARVRHSPGSTGDDGAGTAVQPPVTASLSGDQLPKHKVGARQLSPSPVASDSNSQKPATYRSLEVEADDDDDDDALDELLEGLGDEHFDLDADADADMGPPPNVDSKGDAKKVADLLESLRRDSGNSPSRLDHMRSEDDDDSDGEQMTHAVERVLSQMRDEISLLQPPPAADWEDHRDNHEQPGSGEAEFENSQAPKGDLDPVSCDLRTDDDAPLSLPAVPSQLVDPVPDATNEGHDRRCSVDFETEIAARLASLRGLGSGGSVDAWGLPSAPTFRPQDRPPNTVSQGLLRSAKYTDEDQKTWCVVCLEDATIRCVGCDNDVYCARCWREMHVGPSAGYDERGHKWVKFERNNHS
ncbi:hypothetical protein VTK56DRAFT_1788 [Thermocarpiscus australiensis]